MKAIPGRFVHIHSGQQFEGYEEAGYVDSRITKAGRLSQNQRHNYQLPDWRMQYLGSNEADKPIYTFVPRKGNTARYDPATEEIARLVRRRITSLEADLKAEVTRLHALYDYQAGTKPPDTGVVAQAREGEARP